VLYVSRSRLGDIAIGVGAFGQAVWVQRESVGHSWKVWRTRRPERGISRGEDEGLGSAGVREPRRPLPGHLGGAAVVDPRLGDH
jgi:hypothetical protein